MWRAFRAADVLGGLGLELHKCVIIPLEGGFSPVLEKDMRQWLLDHMPPWATMNIADSGGVLGCASGPCGGRAQHVARSCGQVDTARFGAGQ
eukprot:7346943-Pyramimonas_sp.AAC.1